MKKTNVLNTFKHNLKKQYLGNLGRNQDKQGCYQYLVILINYFLFIYLFIYSFICFLILFIYLIYLLIDLFIYLPIYLFTYLPFFFSLFFYIYFTYLPSLTIHFILFIMHPFHYLIMFLTCSFLCQNIIVFLAFMYLLIAFLIAN